LNIHVVIKMTKQMHYTLYPYPCNALRTLISHIEMWVHAHLPHRNVSVRSSPTQKCEGMLIAHSSPMQKCERTLISHIEMWAHAHLQLRNVNACISHAHLPLTNLEMWVHTHCSIATLLQVLMYSKLMCRTQPPSGVRFGTFVVRVTSLALQTCHWPPYLWNKLS
jgi:hypothetical protein